MHLTICSWICILLYEAYATEMSMLLLKEKIQAR